jgi:hypothetical protein
MDIFAEPVQTNGHTSNGIPMLEETPAAIAAVPAVAPAVVPPPAHADPHQGRVTQAVHFMASTYWTKDKMRGELLAQWNGYYQALLNGATDAAQVTRASQLADYAFVIALSRQNMQQG